MAQKVADVLHIPYGVEFKNPNFAGVAEAMGAKGIRIEQPKAFRGANRQDGRSH